jgi:hypothetical protein
MQGMTLTLCLLPVVRDASEERGTHIVHRHKAFTCSLMQACRQPQRRCFKLATNVLTEGNYSQNGLQHLMRKRLLTPEATGCRQGEHKLKVSVSNMYSSHQADCASLASHMKSCIQVSSFIGFTVDDLTSARSSFAMHHVLLWRYTITMIHYCNDNLQSNDEEEHI